MNQRVVEREALLAGFSATLRLALGCFHWDDPVGYVLRRHATPVKILVVGSGGREHTLAWKLKQSPRVDRIFCAPGNAGTEELGENVAIPANDLPALVHFAKEN